MVQMIVALVASALSVLLFRAKPPTVCSGACWRHAAITYPCSHTRESLRRCTPGQPPSRSVIDGPDQVAGYTYGRAFKETWKNKSFVAIAVVFGIGYGYVGRQNPRHWARFKH